MSSSWWKGSLRRNWIVKLEKKKTELNFYEGICAWYKICEYVCM